MALEKPYSDWVVEKEFPFSDGSMIGGGVDSNIYLEDGKFGKFYGRIHPWTVVDYHRIHASLSSLGIQEVETRIGALLVSILDLGLVYKDPKKGFFSMPKFIDGTRISILEEKKSLDEVREAFGINKIGTNGLLETNAKVIEVIGGKKHIKVTDLGGNIESFVEHNRRLIS